MYVVFSVWVFEVLWLAVVFAAVLVVSCGIRAAGPGTLGGAWARNRRDHTDPETQETPDWATAAYYGEDVR